MLASAARHRRNAVNARRRSLLLSREKAGYAQSPAAVLSAGYCEAVSQRRLLTVLPTAGRRLRYF